MPKAQRRRLQWVTLTRQFRIPLNLTPGPGREVKREAVEAWQQG